MDTEQQQQADDRTDFEKDVEAWNLPRAPVVVAAPLLDQWPELEPVLDDRVEILDPQPAS